MSAHWIRQLDRYIYIILSLIFQVSGKGVKGVNI
jgi:hypothetical protein